MVNKKLEPLKQDVRVYRGSDISSDHFLVVAKMIILERWRKNTDRTTLHDEVFKVYLL